jgi:hypothetical protein
MRCWVKASAKGCLQGLASGPSLASVNGLHGHNNLRFRRVLGGRGVPPRSGGRSRPRWATASGQGDRDWVGRARLAMGSGCLLANVGRVRRGDGDPSVQWFFRSIRPRMLGRA